MSTVQTKQTNLREKLAELLDFRKMRDRLSGLGLYIGKDRTGTDENLLVRGGANVDDLQIGEIAALVGGTAVDVFVYDTSRDSDGGAWRKRTQHTSWYNEELNTATRGARREFPAVAVIVAEADKVTIYDGDDPDMSMWMVLEQNGSGSLMYGANGTFSSVVFKNAILCVGAGATDGFVLINLISEKNYRYRDDTAGNNRGSYLGNISQRHELKGWAKETDLLIINDNINDVAMTVLPNAPIDEDTGLPVPTIAVATNGGVSVIKDDGTVVDSQQPQAYNITFDGTNIFGYIGGGVYSYYIDYTSDGFQPAKQYWSTAPTTQLMTSVNTEDSVTSDAIGMASAYGGLVRIDHNIDNFDEGMVAYTTSKYNTGWMPGDIKLATLSDTTVETIGVNSDELINNGDFSDPFDQENDGWYDQPASGSSSPWVISEGVASHEEDASYLQQNNVFKTGKQYALTFTVTGAVILPIGVGIGSTTQNITFGAGTHTYVGTAITTSLQFYSNTNTTIDNVSVRATTELITNGDFSAGDDGSWTKGAGWTIVGGVASISNSTAETHITQEVYVEAGKVYAFEAELINHTGGTFGISWNNGTTQLTSVNDVTTTRTSDGQFLRYLKASSSGTVTLSIFAGTGGTGSVNNVSFREVELDRSVNNNGLQIVGAIDKTRVAPGADLVAYSGFSANDYLVQPYNEDLNFGTGDFCIMFWLNLEVNDAYDRIIAKKNDWAFETGQNNAISFKVWNGAAYGNTVNSVGSSNTGDAIFGAWRCLCVKRESNILSLFLDGIERTDPDNPYLSNTDMTSEFGLSIGYDDDSVSPAEKTSLSLLRISKTAPTAEQIAKIYRDEKVLFQDGAQATLYGSSDAVTALAYDEKTELLHVGTSSGRSDFCGLRRINNTTTAITTSISAHNNLIAEQ